MATRKKTARAPARKKAPVKPAKKAVKKAAAKKAASRVPLGPSARERGVTVDAYVAGLGDWRGEIVSALRKLIREAAPDATESIKWGQPVYEHNGPFAHMKAFKSHVNFGFWRGAEMEDPKGVLTGTGDRMRHVELRSLADIDAPTLQSMVRTAVALNHAKGDPTQRR
jgi:hypothetical protein